MHEKKVIEKTRFLRFCSRLFSVPKWNSAEMRTILDLSLLNKFIENPSFKMLTLTQVRLLLPPGAWTISLDLENGFWHLAVAKSFRPFLGFSYRGQNWRFKAMPFGLNLASRIFTKIISFVVNRLSLEGIWCLPYLDDLLIIATSEECLLKLQKSLEVIQTLGWIINMEKSRLVPQQAFEWLGVDYELRSFTVKNTTRMCLK